MKIRPRYRNWFPRLFGMGAITLYPWVLFKMTKQEALERRVIQHECVHVRQVRALGWFTFYLTYIGKWIAGLFKAGSAYMGISYEKDAYAQQWTLELTQSEQEEFGV